MHGKRPVVPEGLSPSTRQLAVVDEASRVGSARHRLVMGVLWASLGSTFVVLAPVLSNVLVAFGFAVVMCGAGRRERVVALLVALAAGCASTGLLYGPYNLPMTVLSVAGAYALARSYVVSGLTTEGFLLVAAAVAAGMVGVDAASTSLQGTSIAQVMTTTVDQALEGTWGSLDPSSTAAVLAAKESVIAHWPTLYFVAGLGIALCSVLGAWMASRTGGARTEAGLVVRYDVPLWVAVLFALGVAAQLLGPHLPAGQREVATAGANAVMCCRIALAQQGISVLWWWLRERGLGWPARAMVVLAAVWLELSFACTSVLGLVDTGVNFRRLRRRRPSLSLGSAEVR